MMRLIIGLGLFTTLAASPALAQQNALVGTWEMVSIRNSDGRVEEHRNGLMINTADGHFSVIQVATNRPKLNKELSQMTRDELSKQLEGLNVRGGTYTISGNRVTRHYTVSLSPIRENTDDVFVYKIDGDALMLTFADPTDKREFKWRRARSAGNGTR